MGDYLLVHDRRRAEARRCKITHIHTDGEHVKLDTVNAGRLILHHTACVQAVFV